MLGKNYRIGDEETHSITGSARLSFRKESRGLEGLKEESGGAEDVGEIPGGIIFPIEEEDEGDRWTLSESFDLESEDHRVRFSIKSALEPSSEDPGSVDFVVTIQDESVGENQLLMFDSLKYSIAWNNIAQGVCINKSFLFETSNAKGSSYFDISGRHSKFCQLSDLCGESEISGKDFDPALIAAFVKVTLNFKSYSKFPIHQIDSKVSAIQEKFEGRTPVFPSAPEGEEDLVPIQFPTINIYANDSGTDTEDEDEDFFDDSCSYTMCPETMDYYLKFLNPDAYCHSSLVDLRKNTQVNCELADFARSCGIDKLFEICVSDLWRILNTPPITFVDALQIWNIASKHALSKLEIKATEIMKRFIYSADPSKRKTLQEDITNFMKRYKLKVCSLINLLD